MLESFEIDLSGNPAGLYFANIVLPDGKEVKRKLILVNEK